MSVQYSRKLKLPYDPEDTLAALRVWSAEEKSIVCLQRAFNLDVAKGKMVKRVDVDNLLKELTQAVEQVVADYPQVYDLLEPRLNTILEKYGYA